MVRVRLHGGVGVGGVSTLEGEGIREADLLRRTEGDEDITDVDILCLGLRGGVGDERNSACVPAPPPAATEEGNGTTFA